jgi:hypothetical protein
VGDIVLIDAATYRNGVRVEHTVSPLSDLPTPVDEARAARETLVWVGIVDPDVTEFSRTAELYRLFKRRGWL